MSPHHLVRTCQPALILFISNPTHTIYKLICAKIIEKNSGMGKYKIPTICYTYIQTTTRDVKEGKEQRYTSHVGFEVFTVMAMKSIIFWDMTPCSPLSFNRRFGGTCRLRNVG
jgi:hypothetical protein